MQEMRSRSANTARFREKRCASTSSAIALESKRMVGLYCLYDRSLINELLFIILFNRVEHCTSRQPNKAQGRRPAGATARRVTCCDARTVHPACAGGRGPMSACNPEYRPKCILYLPNPAERLDVGHVTSPHVTASASRIVSCGQRALPRLSSLRDQIHLRSRL